MISVTVVSSVINVTFEIKKSGHYRRRLFEPRLDFGRVARCICFATACYTVEIRQKKPPPRTGDENLGEVDRWANPLGCEVLPARPSTSTDSIARAIASPQPTR
jgi:hypothetical protein